VIALAGALAACADGAAAGFGPPPADSAGDGDGGSDAAGGGESDAAAAVDGPPEPPADTVADAGTTPDAPGPDDAPDGAGAAADGPAAPDAAGDAAGDARSDTRSDTRPDTGAVGPDAGPAPDTGPPPLVCVGDGDDRITAAELPIVLPTGTGPGVSVLYSVNRPGTTARVDLSGTWQDGTLVWDFRGFDEDRDQVVADVLLRPAEYWFADAFPDADWAGTIDAEGATLGLYRQDPGDGSVALLGLASVAEGETLLRYETPVTLYRFPIAKGDSYAALDVEARGHHDGFDYPFGTLRLVHEYRFTVDRVGELRVPAGTFRALRIAAEVEARAENLGVPAVTERHRVYYFLAECSGLVARVASPSGDARPESPTAAEYRRLGFPL
jgi:hypothetical protein